METSTALGAAGIALRRYHLGELDQELVLALAWAAPLLTRQLQSLMMHLPLHRRTIQRRLKQLQQGGLVHCEHFYRVQATRKGGYRVGWVWSLTDAGADLVDHSQEPRRPPKATRRSLLNHDLVIGDVLAMVVREMRPMLSGIYIEKELRLDTTRARPICDAILITRTTERPDTLAGTIPWTARPPLPGEEHVRGYALEVDRNTEPPAVLRDKAVAYKAIADDSTFVTRVGKMPAPFWIVTHERRLYLINQLWKEVWPAGFWLLTTDTWLSQDRYLEYIAGKERLRTWAGMPLSIADSR